MFRGRVVRMLRPNLRHNSVHSAKHYAFQGRGGKKQGGHIHVAIKFWGPVCLALADDRTFRISAPTH